MSSLPKPAEPCGCGSVSLIKQYQPERWVCSCGKTLAERPQRVTGVCRECGVSNSDKEFKKGKNLCLECASTLHKEWRGEKGIEYHREYQENYWSKQEPGAKRTGVVKSIQRSPAAWLTYQMSDIRRRCRYKTKWRNVRPVTVEVGTDVDTEYLMSLWDITDGRCALTSIPMLTEILKLESCSVDRIDPNKGYIRGNVQLVCSAINLMKNNFTQQEAIDFLIKLISQGASPCSQG